MNEHAIIKVNELYRSYFRDNFSKLESEVPVLNGLDFEVGESEFVGIMGKSGCGKTTLLKILGVIDRPTKGKVYFCEKDTEELWSDELADIRRRRIGFVFQDFYLMNSLSVRENIMLPMILDKKPSEICIKRANELSEIFGLVHLLHKSPYELSGGEKQRVAICRALANNPDLLLADEPTGNLDSKSGKIVVDALQGINQKLGKTVIIVTHDPQVASNCKRIIFLKDGVIFEELRRKETKEKFYHEILEHMVDL